MHLKKKRGNIKFHFWNKTYANVFKLFDSPFTTL